MNRYLLHNLSNNHNEVEVFHYVDNIFQSKKLLHLDDISSHIGSESEIFYFEVIAGYWKAMLVCRLVLLRVDL